MNVVRPLFVISLTVGLSVACFPNQGSSANQNNNSPILSAFQLVNPLTVVAPFRDQEFQDYLLQHGLTVSLSDVWSKYQEYQTAKDVVTQHNAEADDGQHSYKLALNHLSVEPKDVRFKRNGAIVPELIHRKFAQLEQGSRQSIPVSVDYRNNKCLGPIKKQGSCGSCWAFSATTLVEFKLCNRTKQNVSLSEQQLVDCATSYNGNSNGCNGGFYTHAWDYLKAAPGQALGSRYPYTSEFGPNCYYSPSMNVANVASYNWITANDEGAIKTAVATKGPIAVVVHVDDKFMLYSSGVFDNPTCPKDQPNHAVVIVGYGTVPASGKKFWILRNSWSTVWGENGYMRITRGVNTCGIAAYPAYVEIK